MATKWLLEILWPGLLIYIQEVFWVGNQGEGTSPCCTLYFSDFRTSFSFSLWLGEWDHFTRRTETFQKISNMYGYFFVHITLHEFSVNFRWWGEGENDEIVSTGCRPPSVPHPWMLLLHMQETALWIHRLGPLSSRGGAQISWMLLLHMQETVFVDSPAGHLSSRGGGGQTGWHRAYSCMFAGCGFHACIYGTFKAHKSRKHTPHTLADFKPGIVKTTRVTAYVMLNLILSAGCWWSLHPKFHWGNHSGNLRSQISGQIWGHWDCPRRPESLTRLG